MRKDETKLSRVGETSSVFPNRIAMLRYERVRGGESYQEEKTSWGCSYITDELRKRDRRVSLEREK